MPRLRAAGALAVALSLLTSFVPAPGPVHGQSACTGWGSTLIPPETIRVYRHATDTVEIVPFLSYVETVMAAEWGPTNPKETLKAGAVAVKQFGWYYAIYWRGWKKVEDGQCFDVFDSSIDQVYDPEGHPPQAAHKAAVAASWPVHLRKNWRFFLTGYNSHPEDPTCGAGTTGWKLWQQGAADCGRKGYTMEAILRAYYEPYLEVVTRGRHDMTGDQWGDGGVATPGSTANRFRAWIYQAGPGTMTPLAPYDVAIAPSQVLGRVVADLNGDRREDLAILANSSKGPRILVMRSSGSGFRDPVTWWRSWEDGPAVDPAGLHLVAGDYDGDGRSDLGLVAPDPATSGNSVFHSLRSTGSGLAPAVVRWQGVLDPKKADLFGGDVNGDGRADLAAIVDRGADGLAFVVMASGNTGGSLGQRRRWFLDPDLTRDRVIPAAADLDGDGREDLLLVARMSGGGTRIVWYEAGDGAFTKRTAWEGSRYSWARAKVESAELNGNGRGDLVLLYDTNGGTAFDAFFSQGTSLVRQRLLTDPALDWSTAEPF